jgi:SAM-dependent methyltransferase
MLARARAKVPAAGFVAGDLASLDFPDGAFDLVVCALALDHCPDLARCVGEIARVVRSGGSVIISLFHPMSATLGGGAFYRGADGERGVVDKAEHGIADYITAFVRSGLEINACVEACVGCARISHDARRERVAEAGDLACGAYRDTVRAGVVACSSLVGLKPLLTR